MQEKTFVKNGVPHGEMASLLSAGDKGLAKYRTLASLPKRAWEIIDSTIERVAKEQLLGIGDLNRASGVPVNINGLTGSTYNLYRSSSMSKAHTAMSPDTRGDTDVLDFDSIAVPLPVTVKDFWVNTREVSMASTEGVSLVTYATEEAIYKVTQELENNLFNGNYNVGGHTMYGYTTFPDRNQYTIPVAWTTAFVPGGFTSDDILADVVEMVKASLAANHYGPWHLYIPQEYAHVMMLDYSINASTAASGLTIDQRLLQINNLNAIKVSPALANNNIVLAEMSPRSIKLINGMNMTAVDWEPPGSPNWNHNFKAIAMSVPLLISDYDGNCGIVHGEV